MRVLSLSDYRQVSKLNFHPDSKGHLSTDCDIDAIIGENERSVRRGELGVGHYDCRVADGEISGIELL